MRSKLSMKTQKELIEALRKRYTSADRKTKSRIIDEFGDLSGFHRKHVIRLINAKCARQISEQKKKKKETKTKSRSEADGHKDIGNRT